MESVKSDQAVAPGRCGAAAEVPCPILPDNAVAAQPFRRDVALPSCGARRERQASPSAVLYCPHMPLHLSAMIRTLGRCLALLILIVTSAPVPARAQEPAPVTGTLALTGTGTLTATAMPTATGALTVTLPATETVQPALTALPVVTETSVLTEAPAPTLTVPVTAPLPVTATLPFTLEAGADLLLDQQVELLLARMSAADRVGQLFVVTFNGSDTSFESAIATLIYAYRIGGVVLSPANGNFSNEPGIDTARQVAVLSNKLQSIAYGILLPTDVALQPVPTQPWPPGNLVSLERELGVAPPNLPLLIGVEQLGDNLPGTALRRGFTPLPSPLAIGSTWNPASAQAIGSITGRELRAVGVNLLLGPRLDVIEQPRSDLVGGLGVFSFGGNPDWVGRIGRAYVAGVHAGGGARVATAAGHFPGQGDIDRLPDEEVATIQSSLDDIQRTALPPFLAVTQPAGSTSGTDPAVSDILLTSQMRFNALQGAAGRNTPLSLDPELNQLVDERLGSWRANGGILMTGPLGVPAIRRFYDPTLQEFPARRVALDAFTAGHDLLYLARFSLDETWESQFANYTRAIAFFQERYRSDPDFATQVDASVRRILRLKLRLALGADLATLPAWTGAGPVVPLAQVLVQEADLAALPGSGAAPDPAPAQAAREALTILYPDPATGPLPPAPQLGEQIVVFTDSRLQRECPTCTAEAAVDPDAIARTIIGLYGPDATNQASPDDITSYTFSDLAQILPPESADAATPAPGATPQALPTPTATPLVEPVESGEDAPADESGGVSAEMEGAIADAEWLIFAMLDVRSQQASSSALRRFLRQYSDQAGSKRIVVFGLNGPYFLDATEIGKLTLYYGVYSKTTPYIETAVRALYRSFAPDGAPSVNAPGTRFVSLSARLVPDPARVLPLRLSMSAPATSSAAESPPEPVLATNEPAAEPPVDPGMDLVGPAVVNVGDTIRIDAGPVLDLNGNPVPDGVPVVFEANFEGAELALTIEPALTRAGKAQRDVTLERSGVLRVTARAGAATSGEPVILNVLEPQPEPTPAVITVTLPAEVATTAPVTVTGAISEDVGSALDLPGAGLRRRDRVDGVTLLLSLLTMLLALSLLLLAQIRVLPRETLFKSLVWAVIAGLVGYLLYAAGWLPFSAQIAETLNVFGAPLVVFLSMLLPLFWLQLRVGGSS